MLINMKTGSSFFSGSVSEASSIVKELPYELNCLKVQLLSKSFNGCSRRAEVCKIVTPWLHVLAHIAVTIRVHAALISKT